MLFLRHPTSEASPTFDVHFRRHEGFVVWRDLFLNTCILAEIWDQVLLFKMRLCAADPVLQQMFASYTIAQGSRLTPTGGDAVA